MKDQLKQKSPRTAVGEHENPIKMDDVKVIAREDNMWCKIRESIEIWNLHLARDMSSPPPPPPPIYYELLSCGHVTSKDLLDPPDEVAVMVTQASNLATFLTLIRYLSHELYCLMIFSKSSNICKKINRHFNLSIHENFWDDQTICQMILNWSSDILQIHHRIISNVW